VKCDEVRLAISAQLDGEQPGADPGDVRGHLSACPGCRAWRADAQAVAVPVTALRDAPVPDLSGRIMAAHPGPAPVRAPELDAEVYGRRHVLRIAVAVAAAVQLALAVPALVSAFASGGAGVGLHASREMASFDVAVAVGFLLAAARPARARTFLPVALVLAGCLAATSGMDLARGATTLAHETGHLVALAQAGLLWALTRADADRWRDRPAPGAEHGLGDGRTGAGPVTA
jgi:predicted anti-sigma-YlaC factor YlaD